MYFFNFEIILELFHKIKTFRDRVPSLNLCTNTCLTFYSNNIIASCLDHLEVANNPWCNNWII